jgi:hypothetical protein
LFSSALVCRSFPSAVTRSTETRCRWPCRSGAPGVRIHRPMSDHPRRYVRPCRAESRTPAPAPRDPPVQAACRPPPRHVWSACRLAHRAYPTSRSAAAIAGRLARVAVAAAFHRHQQVVSPCEVDHRLDVGRARGLRDQGGCLSKAGFRIIRALS